MNEHLIICQISDNDYIIYDKLDEDYTWATFYKNKFFYNVNNDLHEIQRPINLTLYNTTIHQMWSFKIKTFRGFTTHNYYQNTLKQLYSKHLGLKGRTLK